MSRTYLVRKNKHQKQLKTDLPTYLFNIDEPKESTPRGLKVKLTIEELDEKDVMRLNLVRMSQRLKSRWA